MLGLDILVLGSWALCVGLDAAWFYGLYRVFGLIDMFCFVMDVSVLGCLMVSVGLLGTWVWVWIRWVICLLCCLFGLMTVLNGMWFGYCGSG